MDQGGYFRPIYSSVVEKNLKDMHKEFPESWWEDIPEFMLIGKGKNGGGKDNSLNKYKVKCGGDLYMWESSGWIVEQDPYGWVHWYCKFFAGRRSEDDERQIGRWKNLTGPKGRFKTNLLNKIKAAGGSVDNPEVSPVIRQVLQHWGYQVTNEDVK